jgi:hypothetical protein
LPLRFVFQLAAQLERACAQDCAVQPRLLRHLFCRLAQALYLQVFDYDNDAVFADVVRDFVYEILSDVGKSLCVVSKKVFDGDAIQRLKVIFEKVCSDFGGNWSR